MDTIAGRNAVITGGLTGQGLAIARIGQAGRQCSGRLIPRRAARSRRGCWAATRRPLFSSPSSESLRRMASRFMRPISMCATMTRSPHSLAEAQAACGPSDILVNAAGTTAEHPVCGHPDDLDQDHRHQPQRRIQDDTRRAWNDGARLGRIINIGSTAASVGWRRTGRLRVETWVDRPHQMRGARRSAAHASSPVATASRPGSRQSLCTAMLPRWLPARKKGRTAAQAMAEIAAQNPQHRIIQPSEIAALAVFLCGDEARGITMENIQITGGSLWQVLREVRFRGCRPAAQQGCARSIPPLHRIPEVRFARCEDRHRNAIAIEQTVAGQSRKPRPWRQHAHEVQRIGGGNRDIFSRSRIAAQLAQQADGFGKANCSPEKPATKRPPRISPWLSRRR